VRGRDVAPRRQIEDGRSSEFGIRRSCAEKIVHVLCHIPANRVSFMMREGERIAKERTGANAERSSSRFRKPRAIKRRPAIRSDGTAGRLPFAEVNGAARSNGKLVAVISAARLRCDRRERHQARLKATGREVTLAYLPFLVLIFAGADLRFGSLTLTIWSKSASIVAWMALSSAARSVLSWRVTCATPASTAT
jgi:hypothetical protein